MITIHDINLLVVATELYKVQRGLATDFMNDIFEMILYSEQEILTSVLYGAEIIT